MLVSSMVLATTLQFFPVAPMAFQAIPEACRLVGRNSESIDTAIGSFNREFVRLYRAKESVAHKREGAAYACVR